MDEIKMLIPDGICDECCDCAYYWENTDTENECDGETKPCHEFIQFRGIGH